MAGASEALVDAVVTKLGTLTLTGTPTIAKDLWVVRLLENLTSLQVVVSGGPEEWEKLTRSGASLKTYSVLVYIVAPCGDSDSDVGGFLELAEEIKTGLIAGGEQAGLVPDSIDQAEPFSQEHLYEAGQFFTYITINYKGAS